MKIIVNGYQVEGIPKEIMEFIAELPQPIRTSSSTSGLAPHIPKMEPHTPKHIQVVHLENVPGEEPVFKEEHQPRQRGQAPVIPLVFEPLVRRVQRRNTVKRSHIEEEPKHSGKGKPGKPVDVYKILESGDREFYGHYDMLMEAAIDLDVSSSAISKAMMEKRTFTNGEEEFYVTLSV